MVRIEELSRKLCPPGCDDILRIQVLFDALEQIRDMRSRSQAKHDGSMNGEPTRRSRQALGNEAAAGLE